MHTRIRKLRKALGLSQVEFARKIGRHPGFVSSLESGKIRYNTCDLRISFCVRGMGRICRRETGMRRLENGIIRASEDILNRIAGFYGISFDWLVCGIGEMRQEALVDEALISWLEKNPNVIVELKNRMR